MAMLGKSSDVVGQVHRSGGHFYASFCIRAFSKAQHNSLINLITLMNKVRIDILRKHGLSPNINI